MIQKKHYLYRHIRLDLNVPFYIGIGTVSDKIITSSSFKATYARAHSKKNRNLLWMNICNKCKYKVEIMFLSDDYNIIKNKEREFIKLYGRRDLNEGTLVNMTDGGEGLVGLIFSKNHKKKISKALTGIKRSKESIRKSANAMIGNKFALGHKLSEKTKNKIALNSNPVSVYQYDLDDNLIEKFISIRDVCRKYPEFNRSCIRRCCRGVYKQHKGFKWKYK